MHLVRVATMTACRRRDTDGTAPDRPRESVDNSDSDRDPLVTVVRAISRVPGIRERAPRRNALVVLVYLFLAAFLAGLFGWIVNSVPLTMQYVPATGAPT
ncbi:hypothetical protein C448_11786 [Halococcus morrhuae DSM 1307]|uniref:Uncharacterized protein n=1 Tax=Halococcus morrhuae DSM 1307 TaxID=931277 RepID=M0MCS7_HALMO|nr:hypothetical protein [Halococcus morrhuae]EMA42210.1 hypothetical protein C448_11786 [Halococcus morrhuae DSM 1307]